MAHRDGATGAAEAVADPAQPGPTDGPLGVGAAGSGGAHPGGDATDRPAGDRTEPAPDDATAPGERSAEAAGPVEAPTDATPDRRRGGRLPRPGGPRTPAFGLALSAIRGQRQATSEGTAELRRSLADKEAQTNELREALDELRHALDSAPGRAPALDPERRRRRWSLLWLVVPALVVVVVLVLTLNGRAGEPTTTATGSDATRPSASPSLSAPATGSASTGATAPSSAPASASASASGPRLTTTPMPWPGGARLVPRGVPTAGPGIDAPGTDVTVAIDPDLRHLDVFERAVLATGVDAVTVSLPPATVWTGGLAGARPRIENLQIEIDGVAAKVQQQGDGWFALPPQGGRASSVVLRYRVADAIYALAGLPNPARRMLTLPVLTGRTSLDSSSPVTLRITDPRVRSISCLSATAGTRSCHEVLAAGSLQARLPADGNPVAVLQADLPAR